MFIHQKQHIMRKMFFAILVATLLYIACSCNNNGDGSPTDTIIEEPVSDVVNVDLENHVFDRDDKEARVKLHVYMDVPKADNEALMKIRKSVLGFLNPKGVTPREAFDNYAATNIGNLALDPADFADEEEGIPEYLYSEVTDSITPNMITRYFIQYHNFGTFYAAGAAHGTYGFGYHIFDLETGKRLTEKDVFTDVKQIERLLRTEGFQGYLKEEGISESETDVSKSEITANGNFGVTPAGLVYQYALYEVACYATGAPELRLSKESVKPYMKKDSPLYKYWFGEE